MTTMHLGIRVPPCRPIPEVARFAETLENAGFEALYVPDSQTLWRDAYLSLYAAAQATSRIRLVAAVSNVVTRHPTVIASLARTIDEVAPGRFILGMGVGHSSVEPIGRPPSTQAEFRQGISQVRSLVQGDEVSYGRGRAVIHSPRPDGVPIYIAATGPRNLRLAGAIGDGAILLSGVATDTLRHAIALIHRGAAEADRDPAAIPIVVSAHTLLTDDVERDSRTLKPVVATIAQRGGRVALERMGIRVAGVPSMVGVAPDLIHAEDWDLAVRTSSRWVSDKAAAAFARSFALFGTADDIAQRLCSIAGLGVTSVFLQHVGSWDLPYDLATAIGEAVLPLMTVDTPA